MSTAGPLGAAAGGALGAALEGGALLASAESALLTAKEGLAGPLHVVRAESASAALSRARVVEDLRRGLGRDELVVHFQPVVSLGDGRPVAAEALVRWQHPDEGLLGPAAFPRRRGGQRPDRYRCGLSRPAGASPDRASEHRPDLRLLRVGRLASRFGTYPCRELDRPTAGRGAASPSDRGAGDLP